MRNAVQYFAIAREREAIRRRRLVGQPPPWTNDPIFRKWHFCNVHREHDKTTAWFREHVRSKLDGWRVVEATICFRWFNKIDTGKRVLDLLLDGWNADEAFRRLNVVRDADDVLWSGAYRIRGENGRPKLESTLDSIEAARARLQPRVGRWGDSLRAAWLDVRDCRMLGALMAYEVVSDLRWTPVLANANDINTWASAGNGCANGLEWITTGRLGNHNDSPGDLPDLLATMRELLAMSRDPANWPADYAPWEMREVEHWACETAKYVKAAAGGRLKRRYSAPVPEAAVLF